MTKLAIVTGATGCLGRNLLDQLLIDKWDIVVLHRKSSDLSRLPASGISCQEADLHSLDSVRKAVPQEADCVFHVAGNTSHWSAQSAVQWKDNVLATQNLVAAAVEKKVKKFVFTSTGATLPYQLHDEKNAQEIKQSYIQTKRLAEIAVFKGADQGLDAVILQPIIVIGAYDYNSYAQIFTAIKAGKIKFALPGRIAFCHARDVARAHVQAFYNGRCYESYTLAGPDTTSLECFQKIAAAVGVEPPIRTASRRSLMLIAQLMELASRFTNKPPLISSDLVKLLRDYGPFSHSEQRKAREVLGYESASLDEMIHDCHAWLVKERRI